MKHLRFLTLLVLLTAAATGAWAEFGNCGSNLKWTLESGKMTISGRGEMTSWLNADKVPWKNYRSRITSLVIGDGVTSIGTYAFEDCYNIASVSIGKDVETIGMYAFNKCVSLGEVTIPASVESIRSNAFGNCTALRKVTVLRPVTDGVTNLSGSAISNSTANNVGRYDGLIYVPAGSAAAYKAAAGWRNYFDQFRELIPTYSVKLADGTKDAANWTISDGTTTKTGDVGLEGVTEGKAVTLKYSGRLKLKSVTATHDGENVDETTVEITTSDISEGDASIVFFVQLSKAPQGDATVQVKIGETTFDVCVDASGKGTLTVDNTNTEDCYLDPSSITAEVMGVTGGNYKNVITGQKATANIHDTIDDTFVSIIGNNYHDGDASVVFTVYLSNAVEGDATVQVKVADTTHNVNIYAGTISGTLTLDNPHTSSVTAEIVSVSDVNFERVVIGLPATAYLE